MGIFIDELLRRASKASALERQAVGVGGSRAEGLLPQQLREARGALSAPRSGPHTSKNHDIEAFFMRSSAEKAVLHGFLELPGRSVGWRHQRGLDLFSMGSGWADTEIGH